MKQLTTLFRDTRNAALLMAGCVFALAASAQSQVGVTTTSGGLVGSQSLTIGTASQTTNMGQFNINAGGTTYAVYCLDPLRFISNQNYYVLSLDNFFQTQNYAGSGAGQTGYQKEFTDAAYTSKNLSSSTIWGLASQANANTVLSNLKSLYSHAYADGLKDSLHSQAFQYAAWEVMLDTAGSYSTAANNLKTNTVDATFKTIAMGYLAALNTGNWSSAYNIGAGNVNLSGITNYNYTVFAPTGAGGQIVMNVSKVAEPGALSLAALALVGLGYSRRRKAAAAAA